jgi:hypothetical protein
VLEKTRIPVSWWLFLPDSAAAEACARELDENDFLTHVERRPEISWREEKWLVRAARPFLPDSFPEERRLVGDIARFCGGVNEGADSGWLWTVDDLDVFQAATAG